MCGIVGLVRGRASDEATVRRMTDRIAHRGPDGSDVRSWPDHGVTLGHRRLSIIDLSPLGLNPMSNEDGSVWIVFNGEIYNFHALRAELESRGHRFRSRTDTEVIVHAYEEWGDDHVHRLRGMFAYALYDRRPGLRSPRGYRLLLVRDRLGIKPLFYVAQPDVFAFGSELKAILAADGIDQEIDRTALFDYLTYLYIPAPKTAYAKIRKLQPGHVLVFDGSRATTREYWDVPQERATIATEDQAAARLKARLEEAVRLHMISDVPLGVLLSGGVDSSAVTALSASVSDSPVATFSAGFDVAEHSELTYAALVAAHCRTNHHEQIVASDTLDRMLPYVLWMYDEPFADTSAIPTYHVVAAARDHVKVLLSGDGGDEVFGGYNWYMSWLARQAIDRLPVRPRERLLESMALRWPHNWRGKKLVGDLSRSPLGRYALLVELFSPAQKRLLLGPAAVSEFDGYDDYWFFRRFWREPLDPVSRMRYLDLKTFLPDDILTKVDRASMASSVEVRLPLLDHEIVGDAFALPGAWHLAAGEQKRLLKRVLEPMLPAEVIHRPKKGFSAPMTAWIARSGSWVRSELLASSRRAQALWLRPDVVDLLPGFPRGAQVWGLMVLQRWLADQVRPEENDRTPDVPALSAIRPR